MTGRRTVAAPRRSAASASRAIAGLAVLLALCIGIPVVLVALTPVAFPHGMPGPTDLLSALTGPDDGSMVLAVLAAAAWAGWATFALAVLLEVPAQVRGVPAVRVRGLGVQQSLAGGLVAAVVAVVLAPGAASAAPRQHGSGATAGAPIATASETVLARSGSPVSPVARQAPDAGRSAGAHRVADQEATGDVHVVRRGDTLWDLAVQHLGDGSRWRRIAELNYERVQPDGGALDRTHTLRPGWRLVLPAAARAASKDHPAREHVVRPGETLSGIAQQELGDPDRYRDLARATREVTQPDGRHLTDADRIYPGWHVSVPGTRGALPRPAPPAPAVGAPESDLDPLDPSWGEAQGPPARAASGRSAAPGDAASTSSTPGTGELAPSGASEDVAEPDGDVVDVRTVAGTGGLLAACVVALLGARRARQQRRRRPGERIPLPDGEVAASEARLRAVADPAGVEHVDLALRALAAAHRASAGRALPVLRCARLTASHLELHLLEAVSLPGPWLATSDPTTWALTREDLRVQPETDVRAPYPALVTIGHDLEGAHVLVDLEQAGSLVVEGRGSAPLPVLAALAVELGTSPWADDLLVTLVGCLPELPSAVATGRLRHVDRAEQLITELEGRAADVDRVLRDAGIRDLATARGAGLAGDAWSPEVVLLAADVPPRVRDRLDRVLDQVPRVGLAAVTSAAPGAPTAGGGWRLRLDPDAGTVRLDPLGITLRPQQLAGREYEHVLEVMRLADADPVAGPASLTADEPRIADLPAAVQIPAPDDGDGAGDGADAGAEAGTPAPERTPPEGGADPGAAVVRLPTRAPLVRLFGPVTVENATGPEPVALKDGRTVANHLGRATALVAYLACTPGGATTEQVGTALSPVRRLSPSTVWSLASRTRRWLGSDPDGSPYYPRTPDSGAHRLHPSVRTDWDRWLDLVGPAPAATPTARLAEALTLVAGRPFDGVSERHYTWAEPLRQEMAAAVIDVAHEVGRRALESGDVATARRASRSGRQVDPSNELLWRDALRAEHLAGNREARRRLVEQLEALADELDIDLEPETERLIAELDRPVALGAAH